MTERWSRWVSPAACAWVLVACLWGPGCRGRQSAPSERPAEEAVIPDMNALRALRLSIFGEFGPDTGAKGAMEETEAKVYRTAFEKLLPALGACLSGADAPGGQPTMRVCGQTIALLETLPPPPPLTRRALDEARVSSARHARAELPGLQEDAVQSYLANNRAIVDLGAALGSSGCVEQFLADCQVKSGRAGPRIKISRPGISRDRSQALVYVISAQAQGLGDGALLLLQRANGAWKERARTVVWTTH